MGFLFFIPTLLIFGTSTVYIWPQYMQNTFLVIKLDQSLLVTNHVSNQMNQLMENISLLLKEKDQFLKNVEVYY